MELTFGDMGTSWKCYFPPLYRFVYSLTFLSGETGLKQKDLYTVLPLRCSLPLSPPTCEVKFRQIGAAHFIYTHIEEATTGNWRVHSTSFRKVSLVAMTKKNWKRTLLCACIHINVFLREHLSLSCRNWDLTETERLTFRMIPTSVANTHSFMVNTTIKTYN